MENGERSARGGVGRHPRIAALRIALALFFFMGRSSGIDPTVDTTAALTALSDVYNISLWNLLPIVVLLVLGLASGCSFFGKKKADPLETLSVEQLYERGKNFNETGRYDDAAKTFKRLVGRFPFGPYTEQAQLDQAYAQYQMNKPEDAYSTVNRFIKTYPAHKHVDYAYYLRGLINFGREEGLLERYVGLDMTQRGQAFVRQSFDDFAALIKRHPDSRYAPDARQRMIYLREGMAQADLNVALFYLGGLANGLAGPQLIRPGYFSTVMSGLVARRAEQNILAALDAWVAKLNAAADPAA